MVRLSALAVVASLAGFAAADLQVTNPTSSSWWVAQSANVLTWTCQGSAFANFTILVSNSNQPALAQPQAIVPIENNFDCSKTITQDQSNYAPGTGYQILLANPLNNTDVYATSQPFEIKALGSAYPATSSAPGGSTTATGSAAGASGSSSSGHNGAASVKTSSFGMGVGMAAALAYLM